MSIQELNSKIACPPEEIALNYDSEKSLEDIENVYRSNISMCAIIKDANIEKEEFVVSLSNSVSAILPFSESIIQNFMDMTYEHECNGKVLSHYANSILGKKVSVHISTFSKDRITVTRIPSLTAAYNALINECKKTNSIFQCNVLSLSRRSVFVDMGGGIVGLVPIHNLSWVRYSSLRNWISVGDSFYAKLESFDADKHFLLSRKAYSLDAIKPDTFEVGDIITVAVSHTVPNKEGYFVELTPGIRGILNSYRFFHEGEIALAVIRKIIPDDRIPCGYRFRLDEA